MTDQPPFDRQVNPGARPIVRRCPSCGETIMSAARQCRFCGRHIGGPTKAVEPTAGAEAASQSSPVDPSDAIAEVRAETTPDDLKGARNPHDWYGSLDEPATPSTRPIVWPCPWCGKKIMSVARECRFCGRIVDPPTRAAEPTADAEKVAESRPKDPSGAIAEGWAEATPDELALARNLLDWYESLDEAAIQQVDAALSGEYVLVPRTQVQQLQEDWNLLEKLKRSDVNARAANDSRSEENGAIVAPEVQELRQRLQEVEEELAHERTERQVAQTARVIDNTAMAWRAEHMFLTDYDMDQLEAQVMESDVYGPLSQRYDPATATRMALDLMLYSMPRWRDKVMKAAVDARIQDIEAMALRNAQASGQSGPAGSAPSRLEILREISEELDSSRPSGLWSGVPHALPDDGPGG